MKQQSRAGSRDRRDRNFVQYRASMPIAKQAGRQLSLLARNSWKRRALHQQPIKETGMAEAAIRNFTINFGPQHPAAHGVLRFSECGDVRIGPLAPAGDYPSGPAHARHPG